MRQALLALAILGCLAAGAHATPPQKRPWVNRDVSPSRYGVYVKTIRNGKPAYRYTYPGYEAGFPPPAWLYYGYPQSGHSYGAYGMQYR